MGDFLQGKTVAVTGAGRGIGRAVALACAAEGANVVVADLGVDLDGSGPSNAVAQAVVDEIADQGGQAVAVAESVATMAGGERVVRAAVDTWGRIDGVVCGAGILRERMLFNMSEEEFDAVVATHLKGHFTVFRAASAVMREQRAGRLIGFTSGAFQGSVAQANYSAAKGGVVSLVRSAALGLAKYGVTANAVAPVARTRMAARVPRQGDPGPAGGRTAADGGGSSPGDVPDGLAEIGDPEDVAPLVVYLLSDRARHITGQVYTAVGGKIALWNQPREIRAMYTDGRWTAEAIADRLDTAVGVEEMPLLARLKARHEG